MAEPIKHGDEWWTQAADRSWLRWDPAGHRWDPEPAGPPFSGEHAERAASTEAAPRPEPSQATASGTSSPPAPGTTRGARTRAGIWDAPPAARGPVDGDGDADELVRQLRDFDAPEGAARVASVLIGVSSLTSLVIGPWLLQRMISGSFFFVESPALDALGTFSLFAFVAAAISVIAWCKRSYDNARALGATDLRYSSGWAIGGWLVPIANFFIPKRIADDLWRSSDPSLPTRIDGRWKFQPVHGILHLWWTVWMIQLLVGRAVERMAVEALNRGDLVDYRFALEVEGATELLFGFAGLLLIRIINDITARQRQRAELVRSLIGDRPVPAA